MSSVNRSLDDLDRLAFRLTRIVRQQHPQLGAQGFTLVDLEERLLPFRETRREMADGGTDAWERVVLQLVSGERNVLRCEPALRLAALQALAQPSPTLALIRSYSGSVLYLQSAGNSDLTTMVMAPVHEYASHAQHMVGCRYCGGRFPHGRSITYCPHCGLDLTKRQCPACSTELECGWRFCVTCGRGADVDGGAEHGAVVMFPPLASRRAS